MQYWAAFGTLLKESEWSNAGDLRSDQNYMSNETYVLTCALKKVCLLCTVVFCKFLISAKMVLSPLLGYLVQPTRFVSKGLHKHFLEHSLFLLFGVEAKE